MTKFDESYTNTFAYNWVKGSIGKYSFDKNDDTVTFDKDTPMKIWTECFRIFDKDNMNLWPLTPVDYRNIKINSQNEKSFMKYIKNLFQVAVNNNQSISQFINNGWDEYTIDDSLRIYGKYEDNSYVLSDGGSIYFELSSIGYFVCNTTDNFESLLKSLGLSEFTLEDNSIKTKTTMQNFEKDKNKLIKVMKKINYAVLNHNEEEYYIVDFVEKIKNHLKQDDKYIKENIKEIRYVLDCLDDQIKILQQDNKYPIYLGDV